MSIYNRLIAFFGRLLFFFLTNLHKLVGEGWPLVTIHTLLHHVLSLFADPVPPPVAESVPQPVIVHRGEDGAV